MNFFRRLIARYKERRLRRTLRRIDQRKKAAIEPRRVPISEPKKPKIVIEPKPMNPTERKNLERFAKTAGVRNRNFLNVKGKGWRFSKGNDSRGHAIFDDPAHGLRAAIITLRTYWFKHNKRSVAAILSRWAPVSDTIGSLPGAPPNSPREYSEFVQRRTGINPVARLHLFNDDRSIDDRDELFKVMAAMAEYEIGAGFRFDRKHFDRAIELI